MHSLFDVAAGPTMKFLVDLFIRLDQNGDISVSNPQRAAVGFLSVVLSGPTRSIISGDAPKEEELKAQIDFPVQLFLNGILPR